MSVVIDTSGFESESEVEAYKVDVESQEPSQESEPIEQSDAVESPASPTTPVYEEEDDNADFRAKIWNAEMRCRGKEAIVEDLKEQLKFAKADYDDAVSALRKLATEGNKPLPLFDHAKKAAEAEVVETVADESQDESWRERPLLSLFQVGVIKGVGQKKMEVLTDLYPTFGHFQDLRVSASLEGKQLKEVLPEGFGEKITDQIEEVFLNAITSPIPKVGDLYPGDSVIDPSELVIDPNEPVWEDVETESAVDLDNL